MAGSGISKTGLAAALVAVCGFASAAGGNVAGGRVDLSDDASLARQGARTAPLQPGSVLRPGDTIATGAVGQAQWAMEDDSIYLLGRDTSFRIEEFAKDRSVMRLNKGAFRVSSGRIGHYEARTPFGNIMADKAGFLVAQCVDCRDTHGRVLPDGLYVMVETGVVTIGPDQVPATKIGYVASLGARVVIVPDGPEIFAELATRQMGVHFNFDPDLDRDLETPETPVSPS